MATVNYIPEHKQSPSAMRGVMDYCRQKFKVHDPVTDRDLVSGVHCSGANAYDEFMLTKQVYGKTTGVNFYQYTQSFDSRDTISSADAHALALEFAEQAWPGHEVLVCTHCDTDNPHTHFVINSVSWQDGHKLRQSPHTIEQLRKMSDAICLAHGYSVLKPKEQKAVKGVSAREFRAAAKGQSWKFRLMSDVDDCMKAARSREDFIERMRRLGYEVRWTDARASITYTAPNGMKCRDLKLHEEKYLKENMEYEFNIRKEILADRAEANEQPRPIGGERGREAHHADGQELDGGAEPARAVGFTAARPANGSRPAADKAGCRRTAEPDRQQHADAAPMSELGGRIVRATGWESEREIFLRRRKAGLEYGERVGFADALNEGQPRYDAAQDGFADRGTASVDDPLAQGDGRRVYRGGDVADDPLRNRHPAAAGIGATLGVAAALDDDNEDAEERRRRIEAREAAQNLGAAIGLAAGLAISAAEKHRQREEQLRKQQEEQQQIQQQSM